MGPASATASLFLVVVLDERVPDLLAAVDRRDQDEKSAAGDEQAEGASVSFSCLV